MFEALGPAWLFADQAADSHRHNIRPRYVDPGKHAIQNPIKTIGFDGSCAARHSNYGHPFAITEHEQIARFDRHTEMRDRATTYLDACWNRILAVDRRGRAGNDDNIRATFSQVVNGVRDFACHMSATYLAGEGKSEMVQPVFERFCRFVDNAFPATGNPGEHQTDFLVTKGFYGKRRLVIVPREEFIHFFTRHGKGDNLDRGDNLTGRDG
ncbi:hypothetical protein MnTg02_02885 [bacterium MnTg02]|nr:hypothetical protein MnTg02_02885 [bacterium MnTg02]